jgi:hypothetical protein
MNDVIYSYIVDESIIWSVPLESSLKTQNHKNVSIFWSDSFTYSIYLQYFSLAMKMKNFHFIWYYHFLIKNTKSLCTSCLILFYIKMKQITQVSIDRHMTV